ncbi:MAG: polyprenyl synthetase family protein [Kiritimatiellae bacterium]|nr:polyprenyl synthetase family protein [Kiritimatiellia bacterium]
MNPSAHGLRFAPAGWTRARLAKGLAAVAQAAFLPERARDAFAAFLVGGKLLRARLYFGECAPGTGRARTALGLELLHAASLLHDDIVDGDRFRRGAPALWAAEGTATALLAGDWLLAEAVSRLPVDARLAQVLQAMTRAELRHLAGGDDPAAYARGKTAELFAYAASLARPGDAALRRRALRFGLAFQQADDAADGGG